MKKLVASVLAATMILNPALRALEEDIPVSETESIEETTLEDPDAPEEPALDEAEFDEDIGEVGKASSESTREASSYNWRAVLIAAGAVVIATAVVILVAVNQGHRSH